MVPFISNTGIEGCRFDCYAGGPTGTYCLRVPSELAPPRSVTIRLFMNADLCLLDVGGISGRLTGTVCATRA